MLPRYSLRLGTIRSITVNVNVTWLVVFGLLIYWLKTGYVTDNGRNLSEATGWIVSVVGAVVLFCSVLVHELSHSLVALRNGLPIRSITLFIFGGVAHMESEPRTPGVELKMALAGPVASLVIAVLFGLVRFVLLRDSAHSAPALVTEYATYANSMLAGFNLVPGFPLDGGRVFRSILWKVTGDFVRATVIAAALGRVFGLTLVFAGVTLAVAVETPGFLWLALVGTFLERLAFLSARRVSLLKRRAPAERPEAPPVDATPFPKYYESRYRWYGDQD